MRAEREERLADVIGRSIPQWLFVGPERVVSIVKLAEIILASEWLRDLKATIYAEGAQDAAWNIEHEALIEYGVRDAIVNPYALRVFLLGDAQAEGPDDAFPPNPCLSGLLTHEHPKGDNEL